MKSLRCMVHVISAMVMIVLTSTVVNAQLIVNGPNTVCPSGTYTFSVPNGPYGADQYRWFLSYGGLANNSHGTSPSSTFDVPFISLSPGTALMSVEAWATYLPDALNPLSSTPYPLPITMSLKNPAVPNRGTVLFCGANESVLVSSSPYLTNTGTDCEFHYDYEWSAPNGWNWGGGYGKTGYGANLTSYRSENNTLYSPGSVSQGNNGTVRVGAEWSGNDWPSGGPFTVSTYSSATLWVGPPAVSNGQVNNSSGGGVPTYVPSGYANLSVSIVGGGTTNWYVANGSGSISPSGSNCSVSFNGFVRVIVDASNRCGSGGSWTFYLSTTQGYYGYRIAPNPAKDKISLILEMKELAGEVIQGVELYNQEQQLSASVSTSQPQAQPSLSTSTPDAVDASSVQANQDGKNTIDMNVRDLPRGVYFLHVKRKDAVDKYQIVLE